MKSLQFIRAGVLSTFDFESQASRREFWTFVPLPLTLSVVVFMALIPFTHSKNAILTAFFIAAMILAPAMGMAARRSNEAGLGHTGATYGPLTSLVGLGFYSMHMSGLAPDPTATEHFPAIAVFLFILGLAILTRIGLKPPLNQPPNEALS